MVNSGQIQAQVLVYDPRVTHSHWEDYNHGCRSVDGLKRQLKRGVNRGDWVGWRLLTIHEEVLGNR